MQGWEGPQRMGETGAVWFGEIPLQSIKQVARIALDRMQGGDENRSLQIPRGRMAAAWAAIERNRNRLTFIFTEGEPLLREM